VATTYATITSLSASGLANIAAESHSKSGTCAGDSDIMDETQDIGTSSELITMGDISAGGAEVVEIKNLDTTNFVSIGFANPVVAGTNTLKLKAGQSVLLTTPSAALYAIADTATVKILKRAVEA
jgi:hypothetical protein